VRILDITVAVLAVIGGSAPLRAQSASAEAETLFRRGQDLMVAGKFAEACAAFDASQKLDPTTSTQLNRANCREKNGQLATAWGLFLETERQTRAASDATGVRWHQVAKDRASKLEPRLSTLTVSVSADSRIAGLEILRDGELVNDAAWNQPLPADGGEHVITARAPGNAEWSTKASIATERDARTVVIPKLRPILIKDGSAATAVRDEPEGGRAGADRASQGGSKLPALAFAGAAVILVGAAVGFEVSGNSTYSKSQNEPDPAKQDALWHSANARRYVAETLGIGGLACGGVAVWLYLRSRNAQERPGPTHVSGVSVQPIPGIVASSDRIWLQLEGRF
jgi:hypothetical protein